MAIEKGARVTGLPRKAFDVVERPVSGAAESLLQSERFMDALALGWKVQRTALRRAQAGTGGLMRAVGVTTRADVVELGNQVAVLQRELRDLRRALEDR